MSRGRSGPVRHNARVLRAEAVIDRDAMRHNLQVVRAAVGSTPIMAVVKADGYGHGAVESARTARSAGAEWLGVALPSEALALRRAGDIGRMLTWLWTPNDPDVAECIALDVDVAVSSLWALDHVVASARSQGRRARVHLKIDTGLSRNGAQWQQWDPLVRAARRAQDGDAIEVVAVWSHCANADRPDDTTVTEQLLALHEAVDIARGLGIDPEFTHIANSAAALTRPETRLGLVRIGIAMYGVSPMGYGSAETFGLRPAMTLRSEIALVKQLPKGASVSYGSTWVADDRTQVALIPLGYADGIPRAASNRGHVAIHGRPCPVLGTIAMDQFVVRVEGRAFAGDPVTVFGEGLSVDAWAQAADTIGYEIVTRIGARVPRRYVGAP